MKEQKTCGARIERLLKIMKTLRAPDGCPWDREQTMSTLRPFILEEAYELVAAIDDGDCSKIAEECGDVLLQVVFLSEIAEESGLFGFGDTVEHICEKLVRRHPHVFGDADIRTSGAVKESWEKIKRQERKNASRDESVLAGIPENLPSLIRAFQIQERAAKVGFDWPEGDEKSVFSKIEEEMDELREEIDSGSTDGMEDEMGDLLFAVVNLARRLGVDAEFSLQRANRKFSKRFRLVEEKIACSGRPWEGFSLEELERFWEESKKRTREIRS